MASIVVTGDTSGSVTIAAPAVASTPTLTLPTVSGTFITTGSSGQSIPKAALPTGSVLQVVQVGNDGSSTTSTSFVDSGLQASITPTSSTSKILVTVSGVCRAISQRGGFALVRGSTQLFGYQEVNGALAQMPYSFTYLDSPATTSSTTYKLQFATAASGGTFQINDVGSLTSGNRNYITLMEIAA